jgi:hypothetical protein
MSDHNTLKIRFVGVSGEEKLLSGENSADKSYVGGVSVPEG